MAAVLAAETALVSLGTGAAFAADSGTTETATTVSDAKPAASSADSIASAMLMARMQNRKIEVLSQRTADSTTYAMPSGELQTEAYAGPVRVKQDGKWKDIDTSLSDTGSDLTPGAAAADIAVSDGGDKQLASVTKGNETFGLGWENNLPSPTVRDNTASYDLGSGQTLSVTALAQGFSENIKLTQQPDGDAVSYRIPLNLDGVKLSQADSGHLLLKNSDGDLVAEAPAPMMWDASKDSASGESAHQEQVATKIETASDGSQSLVLTPDKDFLATATYPVTVDPTTTLAVTTDTWVQNPDYPDSQISSQELKSGTYDSGSDVARSYLKFDVSKFAGKHITGGTMSLYNYYSATCSTSGAATVAKRITSSWSSSSITWGAQPSTTTTGMASNTGHWGYDSNCPANWSNWNLQSIVQSWADGATNYGLQIRGDDEKDSTTWRRFRSANYTTSGYAPKLTVTYNSYPSVPSSLAISPSQVNAYNGTRYATSLTPTLSAKVTDPDGAGTKAQFEVTADPAYADTTYSYTGTSASVASGSTAQLTIPSASALPAGKHLRYRVRANDGTDYGSWSGYTTFMLNTDAPAAPTVTCDTYDENGWNAKASSAVSCTLDTSSSDGAGYYWALDDSSVPNKKLDTTDGSGGDAQTVSIDPANGWHTLYARTVDAAGNLSSATTKYSFGVGAEGAAVISPQDGDTTARRLTLSAKGMTSYTGVTWEYRRGETDGWHTVPVGDVTDSGNAVSAWPVAVTGGTATKLVWNTVNSLAEDGVIQLRAVFTDGISTGHSQTVGVTLDRDAGTAPTAEVGPGTVNELTGDYALSATDASAFSADVERTYSSRANDKDSEGQAQIFGPGWTSAIDAADSDYTQIRKTSATSVELLKADGSTIAFTATSGGGWQPETGAEGMTLTGSLSDTKFTLADTDANTTVFAKAAASVPTWTLSSSATSASDSTVTTASETDDTGKLARPKYVISPTTGVSATTCQTAPATKGCRVLEFVYADSTTGTDSAPGDYKGQVKAIKLWATDPGASAATAETVASYAYDASGRLRQVWDPRISPALKTQYTYDSDGRVATLTKPGELPWTFTYGKAGSALTAGAGMLLSASRPALAQGSASSTSGTATTTVVYDIPLTGTGAPHQMDAGTVATWGQAEAPTDATAVFPADSVPASSTGSNLTAGTYARATITYINADGEQTNAATPGGAITVADHDEYGHEVTSLTAANRELALGTSDGAADKLAALGLTDLSTADRARQLATVSDYSADGKRLLDEYGPLHQITLSGELKGTSGTLAAGSVIPARSHTSYTYDENRPSGAAVSDLVTTTVNGATVAGYSSDGDTTAITTTYDWSTGQQKATQGGATTGTVTSYDSAGRVATTRTAGSSGSDADTLTYTYYTADGSGTCGARPEWAGLLCRTAPAAAITNGGSNPTEAVTTVYTYDRRGQTATKAETANGVTRTTTITTDSAGRNVKSAVTGGTGKETPATTLTYDQNNGQIATQSSGGQSVSYTYDSLGRLLSYGDGAGNTTTRAYDVLGQTVKTTDSAPSTVTYAYDTAGNVKSLTDSVAGTFTGTYDADGTLISEGLPGGYSLAVSTDTAGNQTSREYTASDGTTVASDTAQYSASGQQLGHTQTDGPSIDTAYAYDSAGRLTQATDTTGTGCTTRAYSFDGNSNRSSLKTTSDDCDSSTADATTTTTSYTYDSADRLVNSGYAYDAFGRITTSGDTSLSYYTNDLVASETVGSTRNTWSLDAAYRLAVQTTQTKDSNGTWTDTATVTNHYGCGCDSPTWSVSSQGISRDVRDLEDGLGATTSASGDVVLQFTNTHGDVTVRQPLDAAASSSVQHFDEYGNALDTAVDSTYGWLGRYQRPSSTLSRVVLMGVRLYAPATGRFLTTDPVYGGNSDAYTYPSDPVNDLDLTGRLRFSWHYYGLRIRFNKHETAQAESWAGLSGKAGTIASLLKIAKATALNFLSIDTYFIEKKAKWAQKVGHCLELQWWWLYPGFVPYTYWGRANGCR
ncbi:DNRLRE domain-containing protein [Streptomyces sp. SA15]|uniref:DNRLRE domain-containing protein n=1 Tax=Streptomyces sp. SA15 TaxID=934019 RepID=UPI0027BAA197|nr:DNRLRE domain-containing protein [Streptomyces sp. SA15]